jgi:hypothetical protein
VGEQDDGLIVFHNTITGRLVDDFQTLVRYNANNRTLDRTFGVDGETRTGASYAAVMMSPNLKLYLGTYTLDNQFDPNLRVIALNRNGRPDTTFADGSHITTLNFGRDTFLWDMAAAPDGGLYILTSAGLTKLKGENPLGINGDISGYVYNDANGSGRYELEERELQSVTIFLDDNNNGRPDAGERRTVSNHNGYYRFNNVAPGEYRIRRLVPAGLRQTGLAARLTTLEPSTMLDNVNVGITDRVQISGIIFSDVNRNGVHDPSERLLSNWRVARDTNGNGRIDGRDQFTVTDELGRYFFLDVTGSQTSVGLFAQSGWTNTTPIKQVVNFTRGQVVTVNFGQRRR